MKKKILVFHLYNDYSGSPKVLHTVLTGLSDQGYDIMLFTSAGGILDDLNDKGIRIHHFFYKFSKNKVANVFRFIWAQLMIFIYGLYFGRSSCIFYINTILPLGAAFAGKFRKRPIIYHYHENAFIKSKFYRFLERKMERLADCIICVSKFQQSYLTREAGVYTVPNALPNNLRQQLKPNIEENFSRKNILFIGSLKKYKGASEFILLANRLPKYSFTMVLNDTLEAINQYIISQKLCIPSNLNIYPKQQNIAPFYNAATLTVNLSIKNLFVETFGLTVIESFGAGVPVIVPTIGGIADLVNDGYNGYKIDAQNLSEIANKIEEICSDRALYIQLASNALSSSKNYTEQKMTTEIARIIKSYT